MSVIDLHPQRQEIIEGILAGKSVRLLARTAVPPIGHSTLAVYRQTLLARAAKSLRPKEFGLNILKDTIQSADPDKMDISPAQRLAEGLRVEINGLIRAKLSRRERWIKDAEGRPVLDEDARPILREDGIPITQMDHKALAAHDRNETADLDFLGKLGQLYSEAPSQDAGVRALMSFGDVIINVAAPASSGQVVDTVAEEVVDVAALRRR